MGNDCLMKLSVLVPKQTDRLHYIFDLMLGDLLGLEYELFTDAESFVSAEGPKLNYGCDRVGQEPLQKAVNLLFERNIVEQDVKTIDFEDTKALFPVYGKETLFPFDVFAASFYLVSRYEEYLPHVCDKFGRFKAESTWMFENGMLQKPLVNIWTMKLGERLQSQYPELQLKKRIFRFLPTYDIDAAWAYKHKGFLRTSASFLKNLAARDFGLIKERHQVLFRHRRDPFDSFDLLFDLQKKYSLHPIFFILCGDYDTNDKSISIRNDAFQALIKRIGDYADVGIHPSFASYLDSEKLRVELERLSSVLNRDVTKSRQHFLRMNLPRSYQKLIELDVKEDYTMGFASQTGFRAGIADAFPFFDLENDVVTPLVVHPFALMDGTMRDYLNLDVDESFELACRLVDEVKSVNGTFIYLTHNETLGGEKRWVGWPEMYEKLIQYCLD